MHRARGIVSNFAILAVGSRGTPGLYAWRLVDRVFVKRRRQVLTVTRSTRRNKYKSSKTRVNRDSGGNIYSGQLSSLS